MLRKANIRDANKIYTLIHSWARKGVVLDRSLNYIYENIRDYWVFEERGKIVGTCALHIVGWDDLGEIKSLVVDKKYQGRGIGKVLIDACIEEASSLGVKKIFALTFIPNFFKKKGFKKIPMQKLPHKIWSDCIDCVYFPNCKEEAMILVLK
ncbi:MAG: N-acetyltransferase [Candidatus Omnitrophica bacterium]|nr:N-acetyltransferase [Candidatus Omnitrophota bacterium]MCM8823395.1 N-acetyltransferase [Candidatus Omnitrophota bacterium]MCM8826214.1 N-acetyltransferase [Candidatus Omnitrophota bacterium]